MDRIELSAGTIDYTDTGHGQVIVLVHGLLMDSSLWADVVADLSADHRCIAPTLPLGAHRDPMRADADLSMAGIARLLAEFLDRLDLHDVSLVGNDTGGALVQLLMAAGNDRIGRVVLASCDAFDHFPSRVTGTFLLVTGKLPPALFGLFMQQLRLRAVRRLPIAFGWLTRRGDATVRQWLRPILTSAAIRRDAVRMLRAAARHKNFLAEAATALPAFDHPALVVWAREDRVMPIEDGRRLADLIPRAKFVEVAESATLIPLDRPAILARHLREFALRPVDSTQR
ncbi:MAG TPA: alpha/beta fold hydrolase [Pseudonocardiaceae bacterium]|nr:alpha/beta fold hydrolase [Pseudonocardiaceae bacterium]